MNSFQMLDWAVTSLTDRNRVDYHLHGSNEFGLANNEKELISLVPGKFFCADVFKNIDSVLCQQSLMHGSTSFRVFPGDYFKRCGVGANRNYTEVREVLGSLHARTWMY